jgi:hypothetical protein
MYIDREQPSVKVQTSVTWLHISQCPPQLRRSATRKDEVAAETLVSQIMGLLLARPFLADTGLRSKLMGMLPDVSCFFCSRSLLRYRSPQLHAGDQRKGTPRQELIMCGGQRVSDVRVAKRALAKRPCSPLGGRVRAAVLAPLPFAFAGCALYPEGVIVVSGLSLIGHE